MDSILCLICLPLALAAFTFYAKTQKQLSWIVRIGAAALLVLSGVVAATNLNTILRADLSGFWWLNYAVLAVEMLLAGYIIYTGLRHRRWLVAIFAFLQIITIMALELTLGHSIHVTKSIYFDKLSLIMTMIIGVVGSLICVFAIEYMKDYHRHHPEMADRRGKFFAILFVFLSAMFGLVVCNDMRLMLLCWEVTSFCSFLLIGYSKTEEATDKAFLALTINVGGGLAFSAGIAVLGVYYGVLDFESMLSLRSSPALDLAVLLLALAGLTKSAQFPFSKWLLGAMAGPTPSSALLHSSTMVKAGVFLILRLAPLLGKNIPGTVITTVGGITFLTAAVLAISQTDAKKILAYSTISNLGLIVTCTGINSADSLWAAIMLIIFHAVAKALLFCAVGSTEHLLGSRNVEDMDGLFRISTAMTMLLIIGIAGMFVAPFGMLISKWAAMKAFVEAKNVLVVMAVAFGSTLTLFFWTKWMGKLISNADRRNPTGYIMRIDEKLSMYVMAALVVLTCLSYPLISDWLVIPYIGNVMHSYFEAPINRLATTMIILMMCLLFVLPLVVIPLFRVAKVKPTSVYLSGENAGDNESFYSSMGKVSRVEMRNWYMEGFFRPDLCDKAGYILCYAILMGGLLAAVERIL